MLLALIAIILTLILVIGIHEAGHALAARYFGVNIKSITIGFGPPLFSWKKKSGYELVWALWPLGGSVTLLNTRNFSVDPSLHPQCFDKQPIWIRICILLAGSFANLVTAWLLFVLVFSLGISYQLPVIGTVEANSIAARTGVVAGDQFLAINSEETPGWREVAMRLVESWGTKDVAIKLKHADGSSNTVHFDLSQVPFAAKDHSLFNSLGIQVNKKAPRGLLRFPSLLGAMGAANSAMSQIVYLFFKMFAQLIAGVIPFSVLIGPFAFLGIAVISFMQGLSLFLFFIATLSTTLAVLNLLPIPVLDGGSIVYALVEKIRKKSASVALEVLIHRLVLIVFCVLLVHLIVNDLVRFYS